MHSKGGEHDAVDITLLFELVLNELGQGNRALPRLRLGGKGLILSVT